MAGRNTEESIEIIRGIKRIEEPNAVENLALRLLCIEDRALFRDRLQRK